MIDDANIKQSLAIRNQVAPAVIEVDKVADEVADVEVDKVADMVMKIPKARGGAGSDGHGGSC